MGQNVVKQMTMFHYIKKNCFVLNKNRAYSTSYPPSKDNNKFNIPPSSAELQNTVCDIANQSLAGPLRSTEIYNYQRRSKTFHHITIYHNISTRIHHSLQNISFFYCYHRYLDLSVILARILIVMLHLIQRVL